MRYEQTFLEDLKRQTDIVRLVQDYVPLKKKGNNFWANCPFHGEKTASFSVNPKGFYYCFGCGKKGSAFNFVMEMENVGFGEAVRIIADKQGVKLPAPQMQSKADEEKYLEQKRQNEIRKKEAEIVVELNGWAMEFWENHLQENNGEAKAAREYLEKRGLTDDTRKTFRLGYAPDRWDALLGFLKQKGADDKQIEASGLVSKNEEKNRVYDRFRGRVIFPVLDIAGKPIAFGARTLGAGEPKYLNSPETAAYTKGDNLYGLYQNFQKIRQQKYAILVEGYLDLITPFQNGIRNCVASLGTALTPNQARLLSRFCKRIVINYDGDKAGIKAALRAIEVLLAEDFEIKVAVLPDGADPDEFIRKYGEDEYFGDKHEKEFDPVAEQIREHSSTQKSRREYTKRRRIPFESFVLEQAAEGRNFSNATDKEKAIEDVLPFLRAVKSQFQKREFFHAAMNRFQINEAHRSELLKNLQLNAPNQNQPNSNQLKQQISAAVHIKPTVAELDLLALIILDAELRELVLPNIEPADYEHLASADIFRAIKEINENGGDINAETLKSFVGDSDLLSVLLISDTLRGEGEVLDEFLVKAEKCVITLRVMAIDRRLRAIKDDLTSAECAGESERFNNLILEQLDLSRLKNELGRVEQ